MVYLDLRTFEDTFVLRLCSAVSQTAMTLKGTTGTTNGRSEDGYKDLTVDAKKQRAREKKNEWQRANRKRKLDEEAARDAAGAAGDGDEDWSDVLDDEQPTQRCSPERTARSPSPEAVRSPSQPPGTQVPVAGQLDLPELMGELDGYFPLKVKIKLVVNPMRRFYQPPLAQLVFR